MSIKRTCVLFILALGIFGGMASPGAAQEIFASWTSGAMFDLGAVSGTATTTNPMNANDNLLSSMSTLDGATNYPSTWFTPTPQVGATWSAGSVSNTSGGASGSVDVVVTFSEPVFNPRFHFVNLDNATVDFDGFTVTRLSGNPEFEVTGAIVNSTPNSASNSGCEDAGGANPNGGCGTVEIDGSHTSIVFTATDTNLSTNTGDGFQWTVSIDSARAPLHAIPTASHWGLLALGLLLAGAALFVLRFSVV